MMVETYIARSSPRHDMLCRICESVISQIGTPPGARGGPEPELFSFPEREDSWTGAHHTEDLSLVRSKNFGCCICNSLFNDLPSNERDRLPSARTFYEIRPSGVQRWVLRIIIELPADGSSPAAMRECHGNFKILPKDVLSTPPVNLRLEDSTGSARCQKQVREWLHDCKCAHSACNKDWRTASDHRFRLLNISKKVIRLKEVWPGECPKYASLSHNWDHGPEKPFSRLTTKNFADWTEGVDESRIPCKFQHAAKVARWLGVAYLWIDALCIVQDDKNDWLPQLGIMGNIYAGSFCNIAAMSGSGAEGFLRDRQLTKIEPFMIPHPEQNSRQDSHVIGYDDFWCNNLLSSPLHNRAWVLQERQLSPRTIHFGEQIFWECREHKACEVYPTGIPREFSNRRTKAWRQSVSMFNPQVTMPQAAAPRSFFSSLLSYLWPATKQITAPSKQEAHQLWSTLVERYMECKLTDPSDKLVAIQGLANKVQDTTGQRYLAGHWYDSELASSLLWYTPAKRQGDGAPSVKHLKSNDGYRAPSWSWASLDGTIAWKWPTQYSKQLVQIVDADTPAPAEPTYVHPRPIEMQVRGTLLACRVRVINKDEHGNPIEDGRYAVQPKPATTTGPRHGEITRALSSAEPIILFDEAIGPEHARDVCLLPVLTDWRGRPGQSAAPIAGLILSQLTSGGRVVYARIGVFYLEGAGISGALRQEQIQELQDVFLTSHSELFTII